MSLVGTDNGTSSCNLRTDKLRVDVFAFGDKEHLFGDDSLAGEMHLSVTLMLAFTGFDPFLAHLGETILGVVPLRTRGIVEIQNWLFEVLEVDATEWDF